MGRAIQRGVPGMRAVLLLGFTLSGWPPSIGAEMSPLPAAPVAQVRDTTFRHGKHDGVECLECHSMESSHGAQRIQDVSDCRACHHTEDRLDRACAECHVSAEMEDVVHAVQRTFNLSVRDRPFVRELHFRHLEHEERACRECHAEGPSFAVPDLDCQACHEEHHAENTSGCMSCHREPTNDAHTLEVHQTCSGSGCHVGGPIQDVPQSRVGCLWCHEEQTDHESEGECVDCHVMSLPLSGTDQSFSVPLGM